MASGFHVHFRSPPPKKKNTMESSCCTRFGRNNSTCMCAIYLMLMQAMNWRALLKLDTTLLLVMRDSLLMIMSASTCPAGTAHTSGFRA